MKKFIDTFLMLLDEFIFGIPFRIITKIRVFIEYIGNWIEITVWRLHDPVVLVSTIILLFPILRYALNRFFDFYTIHFGGGMTFFSTADTTFRDFQTNEEKIFYTIIFTGLTIDLIFWFIRGSSKNIKNVDDISFSAKFFSIIPYTWFFIEMTTTYWDWNEYIIFSDPDNTFQIALNIMERMAPLLSWYTTLPLQKFLDFFLFFLFYYGIARNKETFSFFIRYHYTQAIIFMGIFTFQSHLFGIFAQEQNNPIINGYISICSYMTIVILLCLSFSSIVFGKETNIPFIHESIFYHTGSRDEDLDNPLGIIKDDE